MNNDIEKMRNALKIYEKTGQLNQSAKIAGVSAPCLSLVLKYRGLMGSDTVQTVVKQGIDENSEDEEEPEKSNKILYILIAVVVIAIVFILI